MERLENCFGGDRRRFIQEHLSIAVETRVEQGAMRFSGVHHENQEYGVVAFGVVESILRDATGADRQFAENNLLEFLEVSLGIENVAVDVHRAHRSTSKKPAASIHSR